MSAPTSTHSSTPCPATSPSHSSSPASTPSSTCPHTPASETTRGGCPSPPSLSLSSESISVHGVYLLDDSRFLYVYIGQHCDPHTLDQLFDANFTFRGGSDEASLPSRVQLLISTVRLQKANYQPLQVISRRIAGGGETLDESLFFGASDRGLREGEGGLGGGGGEGEGEGERGQRDELHRLSMLDPQEDSGALLSLRRRVAGDGTEWR